MVIDGASDCKPASEPRSEHTSNQKPDYKPTKLRRFMSIGSRGHNPPSKPLEPGDTAPMTTLSPQPADSEPGSKKDAKRSVSTALGLEKKDPSGNGEDDPNTVQGHLPATKSPSASPLLLATKPVEISIEGQGHLPGAGGSHQSMQVQTRKDSGMSSSYKMGALPSRSAALTSHPVGKEDFESGVEVQRPGEV